MTEDSPFPEENLLGQNPNQTYQEDIFFGADYFNFNSEEEEEEGNKNNDPESVQEESSNNNPQLNQEESSNIKPQLNQEESSNNNLQSAQEKCPNNNPHSNKDKNQINSNSQPGQIENPNTFYCSQLGQDQKPIINSQSNLNNSQTPQEERPNNISQSSQENGLNNNSKIIKEESSINYSQLKQKESQNSALTEVESKIQKLNHPINEEVIGQKPNIPNQNNKKRNISNILCEKKDDSEKINSTAIFTTKKRGRKKKDSTGTGGHNKNAKDNLRKKNWRLIMDSYLEIFNTISSPDRINKTNFMQQYGNNIIENNQFLEIKMYQYFSYDTKYYDNKEHKKIGSQNYNIISEMIFVKKNPAYIGLMKCTLKESYDKFMNNEKYIIFDGKKYNLPNFKTFNDFAKTKKNEKQLKILKTLVDYIKKDGPKIKRKEESNRKMDYLFIPLLEY